MSTGGFGMFMLHCYCKKLIFNKRKLLQNSVPQMKNWKLSQKYSTLESLGGGLTLYNFIIRSYMFYMKTVLLIPTCDSAIVALKLRSITHCQEDCDFSFVALFQCWQTEPSIIIIIDYIYCHKHYILY